MIIGSRIYITRVYASRILISMRFTSVSLIICTQLFMQTNPVIVGSVLYRVAGQRGRMGKGGTLVSIKWRGVSKSIGSSGDDEPTPRGNNRRLLLPLAGWKVGLDQSGANEEVNGLSCFYLSLLSMCVTVCV